MVQCLCDQCRRDFARRDPIWREQPSYRRILLQGSGEGAARGGRDRSARRGRSAIHQGSARRLISRSRRRDAMPVYTVHARVTNSVAVAATDRFAFVRDGFHCWAFLLGPVWLAGHRLWLALVGWLVLMAAADIAMVRLGVGAGTVLFADI